MGDKGGTKQPIKRKTAGFRVGDKIRCISPASRWYTLNKEYEVVEHPVSFLAAVQGADGLYDELIMIMSKFELVKPESKED